jgi:glycosyltransferase involved in cell wall biosynthesis
VADRPEVSVVTSGHDVADARLHREVAALRRQHLRVEVLALGDPRHGPDGSVVRTWPRGGLVRRVGLAVRLPMFARGRVLVALDPDSLLGCSLLRRRRPLVADIHEDYLALLDDRAWARGPAGVAGRAMARVAGWLAARADLVVVADDHIGPHRAQGRLVVPNLPDPDLLPQLGSRDSSPRAVYVGDVRESRGLFAMLQAIDAAPGWSLDVVGPVAPRDRIALDHWLALHTETAARIRLHGRRPPEASWKIARGAWAGLALLEPTRAFSAAVPTKLYEYLACAIPAIVTPLPRMAAIVTGSGAGAVVSDAEQAAATLREWAAHPEEHARLREHAIVWGRPHLEKRPYDQFAVAVASLVAPSLH